MNRQPALAILLAAGRGQRLRPLTDNTPKPLLPVDGRPLLDHVLTAVRLAGIGQVIVVTHHLAEQIEAYVGEGLAWGLQADCCRQPYLGGTAHALQTAVTAFPTLFDRDRPFLLSAADYALVPHALADLVAKHVVSSADITVSLKRLPPSEIAGRSTVVLGADDDIVQIIEKPPPEFVNSPLAASLIFVLPGVLLDYLPDTLPSPRGEAEIQSVINRLLDEGYTADALIQETPRERSAPVN